MDCLSPKSLVVDTKPLRKTYPGRIDKVEIRIDGICKICEKPAVDFRTAQAKLEAAEAAAAEAQADADASAEEIAAAKAEAEAAAEAAIALFRGEDLAALTGGATAISNADAVAKNEIRLDDALLMLSDPEEDRSVANEFAEAGIEIAFPQRDIHVYHENANGNGQRQMAVGGHDNVQPVQGRSKKNQSGNKQPTNHFSQRPKKA